MKQTCLVFVKNMCESVTRYNLIQVIIIIITIFAVNNVEQQAC